MRANWTLPGTVKLLNSDSTLTQLRLKSYSDHIRTLSSMMQDVGAWQAELQPTPAASPAGHTAASHILQVTQALTKA